MKLFLLTLLLFSLPLQALQLGDTAPSFVAKTTHGEINFSEWREDQWVVLFSHPASFTPVCTTELAAVERLRDAFSKRKVQALALAVSPLDDLKRWLDDIEISQGVRPSFPIISDQNRTVSTLYGMLHPRSNSVHTVRSVFIIDPRGRIRLKMDYPPSIGRNFDELLRAIDALQTTYQYPVLTPADWQPGEEVIVSPRLSDEDSRVLFPAQKKPQLPYLKYTPPP